MPVVKKKKTKEPEDPVLKKRHTVAVDLDGVLAKYKGWQGIEHIGDPIPGAVEFCNRLSESYDVVINTSRCNPVADGRPERCTSDHLATIVKKWLDAHGFKYHSVYTGTGKVIASAYVDDRAVSCRPQDDTVAISPESEFQLAVDEVEYLCEYTSKKEIDKSG